MASLHVPNGEDKFPDPKSMTLAVLGCGQLLLSLRNCPSSPFAKETLTKASPPFTPLSPFLRDHSQSRADFRLHPGTLGISILSGILASITQASTSPSPAYPDSGTATPTTDSPPPRTPTKFTACIRRPESAKRIRNALREYPQPVTILQNENVKGVETADVVILGCKPQMVNDILSAKGMREALAGKLLLSIWACVPGTQIEEVL